MKLLKLTIALASLIVCQSALAVDENTIGNGGDPLRTLIHDMRFVASESLDTYNSELEPSGDSTVKLFLQEYSAKLSYFIRESSHNFYKRRNDINGTCGVVYASDRSTVYFSLPACRASFAIFDSSEKKEFLSKFLIHEAVHRFDREFSNSLPHPIQDIETFADNVARTAYLNAKNQNPVFIANPIIDSPCYSSYQLDPNCDRLAMHQESWQWISLSYVENEYPYWSAGNNANHSRNNMYTVCNGLNQHNRVLCQQNTQVDQDCLSIAVNPNDKSQFAIQRGNNFRQAQQAAKTQCIGYFGTCNVVDTYCSMF